MARAGLVALALWFAQCGGATILFPAGYPGRVDGALHEILAVYNSGRQEMALCVTPNIAGADAAPEHLVWIIALPGMPENPRIGGEAPFSQGSELYDRLFRLAREQWAARTDFSIGATAEPVASSAPALNAAPPGRAGLHVSRESGASAAAELNEWLHLHGYGRMPADRWNWCGEEVAFVWVHVTQPAGAASRVSLPVVRMALGGESIVCPLKDAAEQGDVTASLTVISDRPLEFTQLAHMRVRLGAISAERVQLHNLWSAQSLPPLLADMASAAPERWFVNRIHVSGFNRRAEDSKPALATWPDDVSFTLGGLPDELPGFWYYGDREIGLLERVFREHALAVFISLGLLGFTALIVQSRRNRRRLATESAAPSPREPRP